MPQLNYENPNSLHQRQRKTERQDFFGRVFAGLFAAAVMVMGLIAIVTRTFSSKGGTLTGWRAVGVGIGYIMMAMLPMYVAFHGKLRPPRSFWPAAVAFLLGAIVIGVAVKVKW